MAAKGNIWYGEDGVPTDFSLEVEMAETEVQTVARKAALALIVGWLWPGVKVKTVSWDFVNAKEIIIKVEV